jgi:hypothetical protein
VDGVVAVATVLSRMALDLTDVAEAEINPLFVYQDRVVPIDVRVFLTPATTTPSDESRSPSRRR